jgi:type I restriction enzyme, S subunit
MEVKEGYYQTELGIFPDDWQTKSIKELTTLLTNGFVGTVKSHYATYGEGILYIQGYNVEENSFNFNGIKRVTREFHQQHAKSVLQEGDLLTIQTGDIGVTTIVPKELAGANCHALIISRFKRSIVEPKFYCYYFNSSKGKARFKEIETGSTMKHINVGDMIRLMLPFPPKSQQTTIATALSDTDALICSLEKLIAKKRSIKQGAMQELLRPKKGWKRENIESIASITTGNKNTQDKIATGKFPFFVRSQTVEKINSYSFDGEAILTAGDGVGTGKVFHYVNGKFDFHQRVYKLSDFREDVYGYYLFIYFSNHFYNRIMQMTAKSSVDSVRMEMIAKMEIPIPGIDEQIAISKAVLDIEQEINLLESKLSKYRQIKSGMMENLLTGKIRLV